MMRRTTRDRDDLAAFDGMPRRSDRVRERPHASSPTPHRRSTDGAPGIGAMRFRRARCPCFALGRTVRERGTVRSSRL
jgi:hypothetical protein